MTRLPTVRQYLVIEILARAPRRWTPESAFGEMAFYRASTRACARHGWVERAIMLTEPEIGKVKGGLWRGRYYRLTAAGREHVEDARRVAGIDADTAAGEIMDGAE